MNSKLTSRFRSNPWLSIALLTFGWQAGSLPTARAQQAPAPATIRLQPEDEERGQYGSQHNFYFLAPGKTGEDYQNAGFFGQKLRPYISTSPAAIAELDKYSRQKTLFLIDRALALGSVGFYATQVFAHGEAVYFNDAQKTAAGVVVVSLLATLFINRHTNEYLKQAVDNYNSSLPASRHGALWPRLQPSGLGLAATPQGQPVLALSWHL